MRANRMRIIPIMIMQNMRITLQKRNKLKTSTRVTTMVMKRQNKSMKMWSAQMCMKVWLGS